MENFIKKIKDLKAKYPQLCHAANIIKKYSGLNKLTKEKQFAFALIIAKYFEYLEKNLELIGYTYEIICKRVELLNGYYNFIHENKLDNLFSSQGKFRPTILEEFLFLLFKDLVEEYQIKLDAKKQLASGSVKAYSNLFYKAKSFEEFVSNPEIAVNEKNQDYAIYRKFVILMDGNKKIKLQVPALAIEAKTYIDKTMLDGIIATAEKIKSGNPYAMFISVAETYDVSLGVDPAYSRIDQIYVLRKTTPKKLEEKWKNIDAVVVWRMFSEIKKHLERPWSDVSTRLNNEGVII
ncbi:MAG: Bpu10I family restriction endonuclease [Paludibacteraceae bacterium]